MDDPDTIADHDCRVSRPVFVSHATADRKLALSVCEAIESRGTACWISCRDVAPGENYQEFQGHYTGVTGVPGTLY